MLLDRVLGDGATSTDELELAWWELGRQAFQKTTRAGALIRVLVPRGRTLRHGDVLSTSDASVRVGVVVRPTETLVVSAVDSTALGLLALDLGNLHIPTEIIDGVLRTIPDGPAEQAIVNLGLAFERAIVLFQPRQRAGMPQVRLAENFRVGST